MIAGLPRDVHGQPATCGVGGQPVRSVDDWQLASCGPAHERNSKPFGLSRRLGFLQEATGRLLPARVGSASLPVGCCAAELKRCSSSSAGATGRRCAQRSRAWRRLATGWLVACSRSQQQTLLALLHLMAFCRMPAVGRRALEPAGIFRPGAHGTEASPFVSSWKRAALTAQQRFEADKILAALGFCSLNPVRWADPS